MSDFPTQVTLPDKPPQGLTAVERMQERARGTADIHTMIMIMDGKDLDSAVVEIGIKFNISTEQVRAIMATDEFQEELARTINSVKLAGSLDAALIASRHMSDIAETTMLSLKEALQSDPSEESNGRIKAITGLLPHIGVTPGQAPVKPVETKPDVAIQINQTNVTNGSKWRSRAKAGVMDLPPVTPEKE